MGPGRRRLGGWIFLFVGGPVLLAAGGWTAWEGLEARGWPGDEGRVLASEVVKKRKGRREARVHYSYQVAGRSYEADRVACGAMGSFLSLLPFLGDAEATAARYPPGAAVTVRHDPADPSRAVLETPFPWGGLGMAGIGLVLVGLGLRDVRRFLGPARVAGPPLAAAGDAA